MKSIIKKIFPLALSLITLNVGATNQNNESLEQMIERGLNRATSQSLLLAKTLESQSGILPRTYEKGSVQTIHYDHWVLPRRTVATL